MQANISTKSLHAFMALNECRHFTRAAERCNLSQSAFSVVIQKLEAAAGAQLVERDTRNVKLTPEGEIFADVARSLLADIESAFSTWRTSWRGARGGFRSRRCPRWPRTACRR
jgi:LysR family carnitine catabolism transcriptional activator